MTSFSGKYDVIFGAFTGMQTENRFPGKPQPALHGVATTCSLLLLNGQDDETATRAKKED